MHFSFILSALLMLSTVLTVGGATTNDAVMAEQLPGKYRITEIRDPESPDQPVNLPSTYYVTIRARDNDSTKFDLGVKIGNSMGALVTLLEGTTPSEAKVQVGPVRSTMMMPPPDVFAVERVVSRLLPTVATVEIQSNGEQDVLVLLGDSNSGGKLTCEREAEAQQT